MTGDVVAFVVAARKKVDMRPARYKIYVLCIFNDSPE